MTLNDGKHQEVFRPVFDDIDRKYMKLALKWAKKAQDLGEIPIGAVLVGPNREFISHGTNIRELKQTVLGHAELLAIHRANLKNKSWRLINCTLYVTLEPCFMCAGALVQSRIGRVVYAADDPKGGALGSLTDLSKDHRLNHRFATESGLFAEESSLLLKNFFKMKRLKK